MAVMEYLTRPSIAFPVITCSLGLLYLATLYGYRLYFHPIAKFPGPKLAALSTWYEVYYEVICKGQFTFHIQELHKKYGPIVRVTPDELHVEDSDFWETLFSRTSRYDKYEWSAGRFGNNGSIFTTSKSSLHKLRRSALNPVFSKRSILSFQPTIREKVDILCKHIAEYKDSGSILKINNAFSAFAGDIICEYSFGFCYDHLDSPNFKESFHEAFMAVSEFGHVALQFPWITPLLNSLPDEWVDKMNPPLHMLLVLQRDLKVTISDIANGKKKKPQHPTIFHEVLGSDLPPEEKGLQRLGDEAQTIIGAGLETTAWALTHAAFYILNQPETLRKLQDELKTAIPDPKAPLDWPHLEELPYLGACIKEAIRLSYGVSARNPRISPDKPIKYGSWEIPAGTPVSMTIVDVHHDEDNFPHSRSYIPERWLNNPKTENGSSLDRYFVAFGKDARSCLGINLAHAELYLVLAALFRRFEFELYETDASDVQLAHDFFLPSPKLDSKGVRVKVKAVHW